MARALGMYSKFLQYFQYSNAWLRRATEQMAKMTDNTKTRRHLHHTHLNTAEKRRTTTELKCVMEESIDGSNQVVVIPYTIHKKVPVHKPEK